MDRSWDRHLPSHARLFVFTVSRHELSRTGNPASCNSLSLSPFRENINLLSAIPAGDVGETHWLRAFSLFFLSSLIRSTFHPPRLTLSKLEPSAPLTWHLNRQVLFSRFIRRVSITIRIAVLTIFCSVFRAKCSPRFSYLFATYLF